MDHGAYSLVPGLVSRSRHLIDMQIRGHKPELLGYVFWGHSTLDGAYGDPANSGVGGAGAIEMLSVMQGRTFRSPTLRRKRLGIGSESMRDQTRVMWDPEDFAKPTNALPHDGQNLYLRVQEELLVGRRTVLGATNNGDPVLGPIYVVPPADLFSQPISPLTVAGKAPANTGSAFGSLPSITVDGQSPNPMHIVLPRTSSRLIFHNNSASDALLVGFSAGQPMFEIAAGAVLSVQDVSVKEVFLASERNSGEEASAVPFSLTASIVLGSR